MSRHSKLIVGSWALLLLMTALALAAIAPAGAMTSATNTQNVTLSPGEEVAVEVSAAEDATDVTVQASLSSTTVNKSLTGLAAGESATVRFDSIDDLGISSSGTEVTIETGASAGTIDSINTFVRDYVATVVQLNDSEEIVADIEIDAVPADGKPASILAYNNSTQELLQETSVGIESTGWETVRMSHAELFDGNESHEVQVQIRAPVSNHSISVESSDDSSAAIGTDDLPVDPKVIIGALIALALLAVGIRDGF